jgi:hypothetical protein
MKATLSFLLMILLASVLSPVHAQLGTPQSPTPGGLVYGMDAEVIFPEAVRFTLALDARADELAFAILTIRFDEQSPITIPVSIVESATRREPFTEMVVIWDIPRDTPPRLFSTVVYEWQFTQTNDSVVSAQSTFMFTDPRLRWTQDSANNSRIVFSVPADDFNIPVFSLRSDLQAAYDLMSMNTAEQPNFHVMLYPVELSPGCAVNGEGQLVAVGLLSGTEVPCTAEQADSVYRASSIDVLQVSEIDTLARLRFALADLFTARFYASAWSDSDVPLWFERGLALFYLPQNKANLLEPARRAARSNRLFTLDEMNVEPSTDIELWRAQSYGMVLYVARQIGVPSLFALALQMGTDFAAAYEASLGQSVSALLNNWQRWLFTTAAEDAYAYFPQMAITATPSFTPTATLPRPTATPTATRTPTLTPTVTNTGLPQALIPTLTPTRTDTPAPPSITPRPPGSLRTPTPAPTPAVTLPGVQAGGYALLALSLLVLAGLSAVYLRQTSGKR